MSGQGEELLCSTSEGTSGTSGENSPQPILSSPDPVQDREGDSIFEEWAAEHPGDPVDWPEDEFRNFIMGFDLDGIRLDPIEADTEQAEGQGQEEATEEAPQGKPIPVLDSSMDSSSPREHGNDSSFGQESGAVSSGDDGYIELSAYEEDLGLRDPHPHYKPRDREESPPFRYADFDRNGDHDHGARPCTSHGIDRNGLGISEKYRWLDTKNSPEWEEMWDYPSPWKGSQWDAPGNKEDYEAHRDGQCRDKRCHLRPENYKDDLGLTKDKWGRTVRKPKTIPEMDKNHSGEPATQWADKLRKQESYLTKEGWRAAPEESPMSPNMAILLGAEQFRVANEMPCSRDSPRGHAPQAWRLVQGLWHEDIPGTYRGRFYPLEKSTWAPIAPGRTTRTFYKLELWELEDEEWRIPAELEYKFEDATLESIYVSPRGGWTCGSTPWATCGACWPTEHCEGCIDILGKSKETKGLSVWGPGNCNKCPSIGEMATEEQNARYRWSIWGNTMEPLQRPKPSTTIAIAIYKKAIKPWKERFKYEDKMRHRGNGKENDDGAPDAASSGPRQGQKDQEQQTEVSCSGVLCDPVESADEEKPPLSTADSDNRDWDEKNATPRDVLEARRTIHLAGISFGREEESDDTIDLCASDSELETAGGERREARFTPRRRISPPPRELSRRQRSPTPYRARASLWNMGREGPSRERSKPPIPKRKRRMDSPAPRKKIPKRQKEFGSGSRDKRSAEWRQPDIAPPRTRKHRSDGEWRRGPLTRGGARR